MSDENVWVEPEDEQPAAPVPAQRTTKVVPRSTDPVPLEDLHPALEAILMVVEEPVAELLLAQVLEHPVDTVRAALVELSDTYTRQGRGFDLREVAGGWRFYTRPEHAAAVERFVLDGQHARLTQAALETLAVVAYRQPVSRGRISAVRGVNCDGVMRTLLARGLVEDVGVEHETGATLYRTTHYFLERMGLKGLEELPELAPFLPDLDVLEAETEGGLDLPPVPRVRAVERGPEVSGDTGKETAAPGVAKVAEDAVE